MRVLLIEDSPLQARELAKILERHEFTVEIASDGAAGLLAARERRPDVVLSDVVMPGIDGYEVCRSLKAMAPELPVLLLTGLADPESIVQAIEAGANDYVAKPPQEKVLISRIRRAIDHESRDLPRSTEFLFEILMSSLEDAAHRNLELQAVRRDLEQANAQRDDLMAIVAHELKNPLSTILLRTELNKRVLETKSDAREPLRLTTALLERQVGRMSRIVDDLIDVAQVEQGKLRLERGKVDLAQIARDNVERAKSAHPSHQFVLQSLPSVLLQADSLRIDQVASNFISNAVKYSKAGTTITVRVEIPQPGVARVAVEDEGSGVEPERQGQLFERFYRTEDAARTAKGIGLGLYVCRHIVQLHGGRVGVDSVLDKGSSFWFELPTQS